MIFDSNVIIDSAKPENSDLRNVIRKHAPAVSAVSMVETLGYHKLTASEQAYLEAFFAPAVVLPVSDAVIDEAIRLRQRKNMSLGDALIAATALVHGHDLVTSNTADFAGIPGLTVHLPSAVS